MITYKQLSLADIFTDCQNKFDNDKYKFLSMLDETINLDEIVPVSFISHFHAATGRPRRHLLYPMLKALLLQLIFSIPTVSLLIIFLKYSQELRDFCGFDVLPDASKFTRFKQDFLLDLQSLFDRLVDLTEPICQKIDAEKAAMLLFDTSGIEAWVTENNPKYANSIIKQLKAFKKAKNWMIPTTLIKPLMPPCLPMPPPIRPSSRCISTDISATSLSLASSPMGLVLSGILLFITRIFLRRTRKSLWKKNPIPRMRIRALLIPKL